MCIERNRESRVTSRDRHFVLVLKDTPAPTAGIRAPEYIRLRQLLKMALRAFGFKATAVIETAQAPNAAGLAHLTDPPPTDDPKAMGKTGKAE